MCDISPLRNWLLALAAAVGWAISSAWFAYFWMGFPIVSGISWSITGIAALLALIFLLFALGAASTFCSCVAGVRACALACTSIRYALTALLAPIVALLVVAAAGGFSPNIALA